MKSSPPPQEMAILSIMALCKVTALRRRKTPLLRKGVHPSTSLPRGICLVEQFIDTIIPLLTPTRKKRFFQLKFYEVLRLYAEVAEAAADFGFENGWIQGFESRDASSDLVGENMTPGEGAVGV